MGNYNEDYKEDYEVDICGNCGEKPCNCEWYDDEDDDPFNDVIASSCTCGAYYWSNYKKRWLLKSDCIC